MEQVRVHGKVGKVQPPQVTRTVKAFQHVKVHGKLEKFKCMLHVTRTVKALERISVYPAVWNLSKLGSVVSGSSLGETFNSEKIIQRMQKNAESVTRQSGMVSAPQ